MAEIKPVTPNSSTTLIRPFGVCAGEFKVPVNGGLMICEFCGGETRKKKVKRQHWLKGRLYIVENVEAEVCNGRGERYFHATTLDEIDRYLAAEHDVKGQLSVEVVRMG
jgi:YgiT-type zinc finger domain-containing protein